MEYHLKPRELHRLASQLGWELVRKNGGHYYFRHPTLAGLVTIPAHGDSINIRLSKQILINLKRGTK